MTLRFRAPNAKEVTLIGELDGKTYPMTKGENGIWAVTIGPLAPDVYNYQFNADGVVTMDPGNPSVKLGFGAFPPASMFEIPGDEFDDARDVPHGSVRIETYHSKSLGVPRTLWIYTPPGYERGNTRYPVFYLLHGAGNIDSSWMLTGRANYISIDRWPDEPADGGAPCRARRGWRRARPCRTGRRRRPGQRDEAAVGDAHHDREQHQHRVAGPAAQPDQEAGGEDGEAESA